MNVIISILLFYLLIGVIVTVFYFEEEYIKNCFEYNNTVFITLFYIIFYPFLVLKKLITKLK